MNKSKTVMVANVVVRAERLYQQWRNDEQPANCELIEGLHDAIVALKEDKAQRVIVALKEEKAQRRQRDRRDRRIRLAAHRATVTR